MIREGSRTWTKRVTELAYVYIDPVQCKKCGSPCHPNYCCYFCGDVNPDMSKARELEWERECAAKNGRNP